MALRNFLSFFIFIFLITSVVAQPETEEVQQGEVLVIHEPVNYGYSHVKLPRANFIIKSGGTPDYNNLKGLEVEVAEVKTTRKGDVKVILKRRDGKKFFGSFPAISANYEEALNSGELRRK